MPFWVRSALPLATEGTQECIWNLSYNERRMAIELELAKYLEEEEVDKLIKQSSCFTFKKGTPISENSPCPFERHIESKWNNLSASKVTCVLASLW